LLILVLTSAFQLVVVLLDVLVLVVVQLAFRCGLELHVVHRCLIVCILLLDVFNLVISVFLDRLEGRFVAFASALDILLKLSDLSIPEFHLLAMLLLLEVYFLLVLDLALL